MTNFAGNSQKKSGKRVFVRTTPELEQAIDRAIKRNRRLGFTQSDIVRLALLESPYLFPEKATPAAPVAA